MKSRNQWALTVEKSKDYSRSSDYDRPWYSAALKLLSDIPSTEFKNVLEVGCGGGEFSKILSDKGYNVTAIDGSEQHVIQASQLGVDVRLANFEETLPLPQQEYELIVCLEVLEHIANAEGLLNEIYRILKPGGLFIASTPNIAFINFRKDALLGKMPPLEGQHLRFWNTSGFLNIMRKSDFTVNRVISYGPIPWSRRISSMVSFKQKSRYINYRIFSNLFGLHTVVLCQKI